MPKALWNHNKKARARIRTYVVQHLQTEARIENTSVRIPHRPIKEESRIKPKEVIEKISG